MVDIKWQAQQLLQFLNDLPSCFVTGTDTDAGKTVATSVLLQLLAQRGVSCAGLKPIASGFEPSDKVRLGQDNAELVNVDIESLKQASSVNLPSGVVNQYGFEPAIAPHIAASDVGASICFDQIQLAVDQAASVADVVLVEGVGGWRVPLAQCDSRCAVSCVEHSSHSIAGLAKQLNLPVILIVGMRLGCLNHALLSAQAIVGDGLRLLGWVANSVDPDFARKKENLATLRQLMPAPMLLEIPHFSNETERDNFVPLVLEQMSAG